MTTFLIVLGIVYFSAFPAFWIAIRSAWSPADETEEALADNVMKLDDYRNRRTA